MGLVYKHASLECDIVPTDSLTYAVDHESNPVEVSFTLTTRTADIDRDEDKVTSSVIIKNPEDVLRFINDVRAAIVGGNTYAKMIKELKEYTDWLSWMAQDVSTKISNNYYSSSEMRVRYQDHVTKYERLVALISALEE